MTDKASGTAKSAERPPTKLDAAIAEVTQIATRELERNRRWYAKNAQNTRRLFRSVGVILIVASVSLPFLSTATFDGKALAVSVTSLVVAGLTALNAFFQWQPSWHSYVASELALRELGTDWDLEVVRARLDPDEGHAIQQFLAAADQLVKRAEEIARQETAGYFGRLEAKND